MDTWHLMIDYLRSKTEHEMGVVVVLSVAVICVCVSFQSSAILYCVGSLQISSNNSN